MTHGDDQGLVLPPRLAPIQVVIVPIFRSPDEKTTVLAAVDQLCAQLKDIRFKVDAREEVTPGFKFNDWEMRGVPLRIEIGPKDVENGVVTFARRDIPGKPGKSTAPLSDAAAQVKITLETIQTALLEKATRFRDANIHEPKDYAELVEVVQNGWAYNWWCGDPACEAKIKEDTKATTRNIPLDQTGSGKCIVCGKPAHEKAYISKAY